VQLLLSTSAEATLDHLEQNDPVSYELVQTDLQLLEQLGLDTADVYDMVGGWAFLLGPTGQVSYWVSAVSNDGWRVESIDVR
jgi:hypothetical protein